jgi:amidase
VPVGQTDGLGFWPTAIKALKVAEYTSLWNVFGNPAIALPAGFTAGGLPLSVQLIAPPEGEPRLIQVAAQLEQDLPWAGRHPKLG